MGEFGRAPRNRRVFSKEEAKAELVKLVGRGESVKDALVVVGRHQKTYEDWRKADPEFRVSVDAARARPEERDAVEVPDFPVFSREFLGAELFRHQLQWFDCLEGRAPRDLHPAQRFDAGESDLLVINTPPEHAKSTTVTVNYVTWRLVQNPNVRILVVSKTQEMAKKFLRAIKSRLTSPGYKELQRTFGPPGGWQDNSAGWSAEMIYLSEDARTSGEKDPTVQALGIGGHIYGARADLIIMDDCVTMSNAHEFEKQIEWIQAEVMSRLSHDGTLLLVGTRLAPVDLYREITNPQRYADEVSPWTYLTQPAILSTPSDDPATWDTLWPKTNVPDVASRTVIEPDEAGYYPKWDGERLARRRARMSPRTWALVYQQEQLQEDAVFPVEAVNAAVRGNRPVGLIRPGIPGHRPEGMNGLLCVAGLDPAMQGHTAAVVIALDRVTGKRFVLDVHNEEAMTPDGIRGLIEGWSSRYPIQEWRIERNAFQSFLTQDREVREFLAHRGIVLTEHQTQGNKWDPDFGVASLAMLFQGFRDGRQLIELPSTQGCEAARALVEQLTTWFPGTKGKTDVLMALWFAELKCRDWMQLGSGGGGHRRNMFATRNDLARRGTADLFELAGA